jgi:glycine cleavage system regulatory protein
VNTSLVFTFIGADKPGLVEKLSNIVAEHGGNWLESRMSQLAGQFAGITRVQIASTHVEQLQHALNALSNNDLTIVVQTGNHSELDTNTQKLSLSLIGNDRPGILKELSRALAARHINLIEMNTALVSAPMTAETLFEAHAEIAVPLSQSIEELSDKLEEIANDLSVDITLDD